MPTRDCSHPLDASTWTYPGDPPISVEPHATIDADGYRVSALSLGSHAGTHVDAPSHTEPEGATIDELPIETFAFDAVLVNLDDVGAREPIGVDRLPEEGDDADLLVLDTGWATHWETDRYLDHPYLGEEAAAWCADRGLSVAIDAPSVDPSPSENADGAEPDGTNGEPEGTNAEPDGTNAEPTGHPAHHALLGAGLVILESLTGLDGLPERFELRAEPLPIAGGDGSPVRAVAEW